MDLLSAQFELVTPMFLGGGNTKSENTPTIRPPSVKGAILFWWRMVRWGHLRKQWDEQTALTRLAEEESQLFGAAAKKGTTNGQSQVWIRVKSKNQSNGIGIDHLDKNPGLVYLLGQGLYPHNGNLQRSFIEGKHTFILSLIFNASVSKDQLDSVRQAVKAFGLLGGLGSRSRKGWGSVALTYLDNEPLVADEAGYCREVKNLFSAIQSPDALPPFTAIGKDSLCVITNDGKDPLKLLNEVGDRQQLYRSWGRKGKVGSNDALQVFKDDHDYVALIAKDCWKKLVQPQRATFGMPHNYYFSSTKTKVDISACDAAKKKELRRASPLFVHVHKLPSGDFLAVQTLLPAQFLPEKANLVFTKNKRNVYLPAGPVDWSVITDYLLNDKYQGTTKAVGQGFIHRKVLFNGKATAEKGAS